METIKEIFREVGTTLVGVAAFAVQLIGMMVFAVAMFVFFIVIGSLV